MRIFKERNIKFGILFWLFFALPLGIFFYFVHERYQYQKYLFENGEIGYAKYRSNKAFSGNYSVYLEDGREILPFYARNLNELELNKEYQIIYVNLGNLIINAEHYPFNKSFIFKTIKSYSISLIVLVALAFYGALKLSRY